MARKNEKEEKKWGREKERKESLLHPDTKKSVLAVLFVAAAILLLLSSFGKAGPAGDFLYKVFNRFFGIGYYLLPATLLLSAMVFLITERQKVFASTIVGSIMLVIWGLGLIDLVSPKNGGLLGATVSIIEIPFGRTASLILSGAFVIASALVTLNARIRLKNPFLILKKQTTQEKELTTKEEKTIAEANKIVAAAEPAKEQIAVEEPKESSAPVISISSKKKAVFVSKALKNYVSPPIDLLKSSVEKPSAGDLRANANIIKRTLASFGIPVEMGEINVGPKVTRYSLKPAEGVKLSRITILNQDLALALAAHPIRIEAPIPGKSLVGIEVPNKAAAVVRLGSLILYPEFVGSGPLGFPLGRDVSGQPLFADIAKMPHLLIAGSTGSGKSVAIHSLIISLLYKNSPETLRFVMIDPKRVELSVYSRIPHLIGPVITEGKKAIAVFRWAIGEMDRRYNLLLNAGNRDIKSYNETHKNEVLPYLVVVIDELADLMTAYGREVESSVVRLAQMARATGIHLVVSTQRPSVEVITGLIKANITSRIALQVPSQVDSRTILDTSGAEKLLGGGDMLFISSDFSKPKRIQGAYVSEEEINAVADFIRENNNKPQEESEIIFDLPNGSQNQDGFFDEFEGGDEEDELYDEAVQVVREAQKASASLLQRRLKVGYARAARLLDIMEEKGIIGPGEGAKPREVFINKEN